MRRRRGPLPPRSAKRIDEDDERWVVIAEVTRRDGGRCQARVLVPSVRCGGQHDVHELIPRSAWPGGHLIAENCILICRAHHRWVDGNPDAAHAVGLHSYSWARPQGENPYG